MLIHLCAGRFWLFGLALALTPLSALAHGNPADLLMQLDAVGRELVYRPCQGVQHDASKTWVPNRHAADVTDEILLIKCPGVEAKTYHPIGSSHERALPLHLIVRVFRRDMPSPWRIGAPVSVLAQLGQPSKAKDGAATFVLPSDPGTDTVTFHSREGKLVGIEWNWDTD
jgi:hypothetical protein